MKRDARYRYADRARHFFVRRKTSGAAELRGNAYIVSAVCSRDAAVETVEGSLLEQEPLGARADRRRLAARGAHFVGISRVNGSPSPASR